MNRTDKIRLLNDLSKGGETAKEKLHEIRMKEMTDIEMVEYLAEGIKKRGKPLKEWESDLKRGCEITGMQLNVKAAIEAILDGINEHPEVIEKYGIAHLIK